MGYHENKDVMRIWGLSIWASTQENLPLEFANSDQHLCYSILESIVSKVNTSKI